MPVPNTFANATSAIPLSQLDNNFATAITIGNTAVQLGNTVTTLNNMTLANVTISNVASTFPNSFLTNTSVTIGNTAVSLGGSQSSFGNVTFTNVTISSVSTPITAAQGGTGQTSLTANNVLIGNGTSSVTFVAPGTSGNVLTSNGTVWASTAPAGGGSWVYLSTVSASNVATADIETTFSSTYDVYAITGTGVVTDGGNSVVARLKMGGSYRTSNYYYKTSAVPANSSTYNAFNSQAGSYIDMTGYSVQNANSAYSMNFILYVHNVANTSFNKMIYWEGTFWASTGNFIAVTGAGSADTNATGALTGVRFQGSGIANIFGTFRLYGIKNS